ncbi:transient receptor potential cation channel subfamily V member 3-like [Latimeria chalumnae]|uniref:transient receptor potential cation channel subfamily V member 3-like n=1 Tax=Latimeria chalumnae TaxID=7897 RepID=UPI00313ACB0F
MMKEYLAYSSNEDSALVRFYIIGQVLVNACAFYQLFKELIELFLLKPSDLKSVFSDAWFHVTFCLQAALVIISSIMYWTSVGEYLLTLTPAIALGWINVLYYTRGVQALGIYSVMLQKIILRDVLKFLIVYALFLVGFGVAVSSMDKCFAEQNCTSTTSFASAELELFKLTLGLGDLEDQKEQSKHPELFLALIVLYVILTFVLLLNMLIALMGETVNDLKKDSKNTWKLQRARTILDLERTVPWCLHFITNLETERFRGKNFIRINETDWTKYKPKSKDNSSQMSSEDSDDS